MKIEELNSKAYVKASDIILNMNRKGKHTAITMKSKDIKKYAKDNNLRFNEKGELIE